MKISKKHLGLSEAWNNDLHYRWFFLRVYMFFKVALTLLRFFAAAVFFRVILGGSKCWRRRASEIIDSCCTRLVKRRRNPSKLSPSLIRSSTKDFPNSLLGDT
ncbi:uncharacterized protein METZ01_LOCUS127277 [marine metagenome]|uniref:Uncharacterized protein n=1 Tax=marine metagenome TaxID=408172 RepID=A0A381YD02_9ZZZZ